VNRVLFVCLGNICRSPAGEGVFAHLVEKRGLSAQIQVDSAGTMGYHTGSPADSRMRQAATRRGYDLTSRARCFDPADFDRFDFIIAMDNQNLRDIRAQDPEGLHSENIYLLCDLIPGRRGEDVPDPYYGGSDGFETVLDLMEEAATHLIDEIARRDRS